MAHYGGDGGNPNNYRKGKLYFYNNTVISTRSGNTTLVRLSTNDETAHAFNNVIYTSAEGNKFAMIGGAGNFHMHHNWLKTGWVSCHCSPSGIVHDEGNNLTGTDPLFSDFNAQNFEPSLNAPMINQGDALPPSLLPNHDINHQYIKHTSYDTRSQFGQIDIGAYEYEASLCTAISEFIAGSWTNGVPGPTIHAILKSNYNTSTHGDINACACTVEPSSLLTVTSGSVLSVTEELSVNGLMDAHQGSTIVIHDQ